MTLHPDLSVLGANPTAFAEVFNDTVFGGNHVVLTADLSPADPVTHLESDLLDPALRLMLNSFLASWAATSVVYRWSNPNGRPVNLCLKNQTGPDDCLEAKIELYNALQIAGTLGDESLEVLLREEPANACRAYKRLAEEGTIVPTYVLIIDRQRELLAETA